MSSDKKSLFSSDIDNDPAQKKANLILSTWLAKICQTKGSRISYKNDLDNFRLFLSTLKKNILELTGKDVQTYLEYLKEKGLSAATCSKKMAVIKGLVRHLAMENVFPAIEAERIIAIEPPKVIHDARTPGLSADEARKLLDMPDSETLIGIRDRALLAVMLYTGARRSVICNLRVGSLVLGEDAASYLVLNEKKNTIIHVPLHPEALERLNAWIAAAHINLDQQQSYLFRPFNRRGSELLDKPIHDYVIWYTVKKYARKAGLNVDRIDERGICAHSTRVTAINTSFEGGANVEEVQRLVGHKDARNTLRYRKLSDQDTQNAVMKIQY